MELEAPNEMFFKITTQVDILCLLHVREFEELKNWVPFGMYKKAHFELCC